MGDEVWRVLLAGLEASMTMEQDGRSEDDKERRPHLHEHSPVDRVIRCRQGLRVTAVHRPVSNGAVILAADCLCKPLLSFLTSTDMLVIKFACCGSKRSVLLHTVMNCNSYSIEL